MFLTSACVQVLAEELSAVRKACLGMQPDGSYQPAITYVVVQKRHHTRMFPADNNKDRNGNVSPGPPHHHMGPHRACPLPPPGALGPLDKGHQCPSSLARSLLLLPLLRQSVHSLSLLAAGCGTWCSAGTVVDRGICHPREFDFYLNSHASIQGTSRPTHYRVLWDENKFTADSMQALCYQLCHTYARCTRTVSLVPPAYYADLAGECPVLIASGGRSAVKVLGKTWL